MGGGGGGGSEGDRGVGFGGQGRCEQSSEVFVKIQKKKYFFWGVGARSGGHRVDVNKALKFLSKLGVGSGEVGLRGQGGCDRRIEVFGKIHKKNIFFMGWGGGGRGSGWGGQGGCDRRIEVFEKITFFFGGGGVGGTGRVGGSGWR